jgi:alpha-L-arabinofuranosidase
MKSLRRTATTASLLGCFTATAQTVIFDQNFDGGYTGAFSTNAYVGGGSPVNYSVSLPTTGGNPNGCFEIKMTTTTSSDSWVGQAQLEEVSGNTDPNPSDYVLSFDANGSSAGNVQFIVQTWQNQYYGGSAVIDASVNDQLNAANTWQTFSVNLGFITSDPPTGGTWQLNFAIDGGSWGGAGKTDTLKIDNIILTHLANNLSVSSSLNPSPDGAAVSFTATVITNGATAGNATGKVVFSSPAGPFSTNTVSGGSATSASITNLPVGSDLITAAYFGGNYPADTNAFSQTVDAPTTPGVAQANLPIYTDNLVNDFQDWSWATVNFQNANPVQSGSYSISVSDGGYQALSMQCNEINSTPYTSVTFWINGGASGGQEVQVWGSLDHNSQAGYALAPLPTNVWKQITIPLATLGVDDQTNFTGIGIQGTTGSTQDTFYVDSISLVAAPLPAVVHLGVNASNVLEAVDARQFGLNTATWDGSLASSTTLPLLQECGTLTFRWPGGSTSDEYDWANDPSGNATFRNLATNIGAQVFTTVNYGSGTAAEAAAWVLNANKTNHCNFKYWEVGNECYGSWENDTHAIEHDPYTYASNAVAYIEAMKAAYPAVPIKVGVVVVPGEDSFINNTNHAAVNPVTGETHYGWTPVVLSQMKLLGVLPDFLIYHFYWQYTTGGWEFYDSSSDADAPLLQVAGNPSALNWSDWSSAAASLRQQLTDYLGAPASSNIELCVTENNSDSGAMGRQSTSVVNALYLADSTCELMKTEFRSYILWDLHNGADTSGDFDPTIYGWRDNGDYGILDGNNNPYPTYYAEKILQYFARPGDSVLDASSDNLLLSAYAVHRTNGALTLLVINKDMTTNLTGQIALTNFSPSTTATIQSWGIPQDQAAENNESAAAQDIATTNLSSVSSNFSYSFPALSMTLFTFQPGAAAPPAAPEVSAPNVHSGQFQLLLQGSPNTTYVIQSSSNLTAWAPVWSNTLVGSSSNISIPIPAGSIQQYYRGVGPP